MENKIPCRKCKGHGTIENYKHVENGICFKCSGSGFEDVTKEEFEAYNHHEELIKKGKFILINHGNIEYFKTEKEIIKRYGNFYCGDIQNYSSKINYNDKEIVYTRHTELYEKFIEAYKLNHNKQLQSKINKYTEILEGEDDQEWIDQVKCKIEELKIQFI